MRDGTDVLVDLHRLHDDARARRGDGAREGQAFRVAVLHCPTIKPLDTETILAEAGRGGRLVVTAENHTVVGGLGEAVAATLLTAGVTPTYRMIGLPDAFLEAGALPTLHDRYGISTDAMIRRIRGWL